MNAREAKTIGRKRTIKATIIVLAIFLLILMFQETRGDFANGILFYLQAVTNLHTITIYIALIGLTFLFGGLAGKEIILSQKNHYAVGVKYAVLTALTLSIYISTTSYATYASILGMAKDLPEILQYHLLFILSRTGIFILPLLGGWLWAANQMRSAAKKAA